MIFTAGEGEVRNKLDDGRCTESPGSCKRETLVAVGAFRLRSRLLNI